MVDEYQGPAPIHIGPVPQRTELSMATQRHGDEVRLVAPSARSDGGFHLHTKDDAQRLLVIRRMKPREFTIGEMKNQLESLSPLMNRDAPTTDETAARDPLRNCHT